MSVGLNGWCAPTVGAPMDGVIWVTKSVKATQTGSPYWSTLRRGTLCQVIVKVGHADGSWETIYGDEARGLGETELSSSVTVNAEGVKSIVIDGRFGGYFESAERHLEYQLDVDYGSDGAILLGH